MQKSDIGSQPAFPQSVCPRIKDEPGQHDWYDTLYSIPPEQHPVRCPLCHGTGLVGGGMNYRQWLIGQALASEGTLFSGGDVIFARVDNILARMESADAK